MKTVSTLALGLLIAMQGAVAADVTARFYGHAYDLKSDRYLYTEVHEQKIADDKWLSGSIRYFAPDGTALGRKTLDFSADPFIPLYDYRLPAIGYQEAITQVGDEIELLKVSDGKRRTGTVERKPLMAADSGFHSFLRANFRDLLDGKTVAFTFIAAGNLDSFKFRARRIDDTTFEGRSAVRFLVEANSLLRVVAPNLVLTYDAAQQRLLEYRGPSNVIDPSTGKVYETRIVYPSQTPADAPKNLPPLG